MIQRTMKNIIIFFLTFIATAFEVQASDFVDIPDLSGPDGRFVVYFKLDALGTPYYSAVYDGSIMIQDSPLGMLMDIGDFTTGLSLVDFYDSSQVTEYSVDRIKKSQVSHKYNKRIISLKNHDGNVIEIEMRVSDNDLAFRYNVPETSVRRSALVIDEATSFSFPEGATTFITPQSDAMIGWQRSKPSYEEGYSNDGKMSDPSMYGHGYTFPALFHIGESGWVLISETGVDSRYCASRLGECNVSTYKLEFPMTEENNGIGTSSPGIRLPGSTPWRTVTVGADLKPIVETTVPWDYVEPQYETKHNYKYGRSTWSWIVWQDASCNWGDQVKFIDLASEMGFEYILIDAGWDVNIGYDKMEELISYANSKNVDVFLWYSSSGNWNDIIQSPINRMDNSIVRKKEMEWLEKVGCKGIKVDFWGGDKQETMRLYEEVLSDADDHGLMVIFHGCTLPRGWERMYPNYVGSEAVLASENMFFGQGACDEESFKATLHPFIRNAVGSMEFGGCFMNRILNRENSGHGSHLMTGPIFQLCTEILFQNPIQNIAICPNNLDDAPELCMDWLRTVPTVWKDIRFIEGYPGKYIVLARQDCDGLWHIAAVNATSETIRVNVDLAFLGKESVDLYADDSTFDNPSKECVKLRRNKVLGISIVPNGGVIIE